MKYSKKRGGSPAYELLRQEGLLSTINPHSSNMPLTTHLSGNVSHLIETSGGGRRIKKKNSRRKSKRSRVSKRRSRKIRRRTSRK